MRSIRWIAVSVVAILFLRTLQGASPGGPSHDPPFYFSLSSRLSDKNDDVRAAAQKDLDALGPTDMEPLIMLLHSVSTEDAHARVRTRIQKIIEQATRPAQITLNLDHADWPTLADALSESLGTPVVAVRDRGFPHVSPVTIHVTNAPFWEVFAEISRQQPLDFLENRGEGVSLRPTAGARPHFYVAGSFAAFPITIYRSLNLNAYPDGGPPSLRSIQLQYALAADPSLHIASCETLRLTSVVDNFGNQIQINHSGDYMKSNAGQSCRWNDTAFLTPPDNVGTRIASAKGTALFRLQTDSTSVEVICSNDRYDAFVVGNYRINIDAFRRMGPLCMLNYRLSQLDARGRTLRPDLSNIAGSTAIIDSTGKEVWRASLQDNGNAHIPVSDNGVLKLRFSIPTDTIEAPVDFELKDIPLP